MIGYVLLAFGLAVFVISFLLPAKTEEEKEIEFSEDVIRDLVGKEVEDAKLRLNDIVDETVTYAMEKTERTMDRLTNEKMMAVNEYSDTVLSEIDKNHKEVVFLYDMLNDKHENLKNTVSEVEKQTSEIKQAVLDAEITAKETKAELNEAREQATAARAEASEAMVKAESATRTSAIERLAMREAEEKKSEAEVDFSPLTFDEPETKKPARKKRTTKPKVREEAVVFDGSDEGTFNNGLGLIQSEEAENRIKNGPNLNLGNDPIGKPMGGLNNNEKILELHNKGKSNMAIAKELGLGLGEVKLVIDLYEGM